MPKLFGVFDVIKDVYKIPVTDINRWLKTKEQDHYLENFIGNRIIYSQTVPVSAWDLEVDLAIIREYVRFHQNSFYNPSTKKIYIPVEFVPRFPPLIKLVSAFIDVLPLEGCNLIYIKRVAGTTQLGSVISALPESITSIKVDGKDFALSDGELNMISKSSSKTRIQVGLEDTFLAGGGQIGILVDLRKTN